MITYDEAYAATNPNDSEERRAAAAQAIQMGAAANAQYWNSRSPLEAIQAHYEGHSQIVRGPDEEGGEPVTAGTAPVTVEGTATDTGSPALPPSGATAPTEPAPVPSPDNPDEAIARLRAQIETLGGTPEA